MKATTWRQVREILNNTPDEFLDKPLEWQGEEKSGKGEFYVLGEPLLYDGDYLVFESEWPEGVEKPAPTHKAGSLIFDVDRPADSHVEQIRCPNCNVIQTATVQHTQPFLTYIHECVQCRYVIMESEWNKAEL